MPEYDSTIQYRDIPRYPGYKAGSDGTIWTCWRTGRRRGVKRHEASNWIGSEWKERRSSPWAGRVSPHVSLLMRRDDGKIHHRYLHHLILEAFVGPRPPGMEACHYPDSNPMNNRLNNLRWDTKSNNHLDESRLGTHHSIIYSDEQVLEVRRLQAGGMRQSEIVRKTGLPQHWVSRIMLGKCRRHLIPNTA